MKKIILATQNRGKLAEFQQLFAEHDYEILPLSDFTSVAPEETGTTFIENALIKARHASQLTGLPAIGDDSGLIVDSLHGAPGIYSARYAGENATWRDHINKVLTELNNTPNAIRTARFHCTLVLIHYPDDQNPLIAQGNWEGEILHAIQGENGFGYDPIFYVPTHHCSAAELSPEVKNSLSHRGIALKSLFSSSREFDLNSRFRGNDTSSIRGNDTSPTSSSRGLSAGSIIKPASIEGISMNTQKITYQADNQSMEGYVAQPNTPEKKPLVLIAHDWTGRNEFACKKAEKLAELGYVGFAMDLYGQGKLGQDNDEKMQLMKPLMDDRSLLLKRLLAALETAKKIEGVDTNRIAAIGFCFGGLCVLDLARSGADIKGVVSFHGLLGAPEKLPKHKIKSKILALHGYNDPMAKPEQVNAFADEMTQAGADWQIHMYGNTLHAFTNPLANDPEFGTVYDQKADARSWIAMKDFFAEIFK